MRSERGSRPQGRKVSGRPIGRRPAPSWLSIRVELVQGRGERFWPRPGRLFVAARSHSFGQLARAVDDAVARWDRSHLHEVELVDGTRIGLPDPEGMMRKFLTKVRFESLLRSHLLRSHTYPEPNPCVLIRLMLVRVSAESYI
jgi:hypothetical protein